jgi:Condensation domain/TubC N-terminal docking domain
MPTTADYLTALFARGIRLWVDNGELRYHARKGCLTPADVTQLRALKKELIAELTRPRPLDFREASRERCDRANTFPLSFQQRWLAGLLSRDTSWNGTLACALQVKGALKADLLEQCLRETLASHQSLRTRIREVDGELRLFATNRAADFSMRLLSMDDNRGDRSVRNAIHRISELAARPIDVKSGWLLDAALLEISEHEHVFFLMMHRLVADCPSFSRAIRELWMTYAIRLCADPMPEEGCVPQYGDYARWQQATNEDWQQKHAAYWGRRLADAVPIRWPAQPYPTTAGSTIFAVVKLPLGTELTRGLKELQRRTRTLLATIMLTVFVAVIARSCRQNHFVVPFNIAGRHSEHEGTIGYFSHPLYLRMDLSENPTYVDLLQMVSKEFYAAIFHQDFGRMVAQRDDLMGGTLFQWLSWSPDDFAAEGLPKEADQTGIEIENMHFLDARELTAVPACVLDMEMSLFETPEGICAALTYRAGRFSAEAMTQLLKYLRDAAIQFVSNPASRATTI